MAVIALQGTKGVGKTRTYGLLIGQLSTYGYVQVPGHYKDLHNNDFLDLYKHQKSGKLLGIVTRGDVSSWLRQDISDLFSSGANAVLCACRTKGFTLRHVQTHTPHHILLKTPSDQADINALMALVGLYIP